MQIIPNLHIEGIPWSQVLLEIQGAQWLSSRVLGSRQRGRGFEPQRRHCVVFLEQDKFYPSLVLGQLRKTRLCLTERLLMGRKESNQTNKTRDSFPLRKVSSHEVTQMMSASLAPRSIKEGGLVTLRWAKSGLDPFSFFSISFAYIAFLLLPEDCSLLSLFLILTSAPLKNCQV